MKTMSLASHSLEDTTSKPLTPNQLFLIKTLKEMGLYQEK